MSIVLFKVLQNIYVHTNLTVCCGLFSCFVWEILRPPSHFCFGVKTTMCCALFLGLLRCCIFSFRFEAVAARHSIVISILMVFIVQLKYSIHLCSNLPLCIATIWEKRAAKLKMIMKTKVCLRYQQLNDFPFGLHIFVAVAVVFSLLLLYESYICTWIET